MKTKLQNKIVTKYPEFFEYLKEHKGPLMPMSFGIECGDGWYVILNTLLESIQAQIKDSEKYPDKQIKHTFWRYVVESIEDRYKFHKFKTFWKLFNKFKKHLKIETSMPLKVNIMQIKEKFGSLQVYITTEGGRKNDDDNVYAKISLTEDLSYNTCETCGTTENVGITEGWISVCCKKCFDANDNELRKWNPIK